MRDGKQITRKQVDDLLITHRCYSRCVVKVAGDHRALGLPITPESLLRILMQLIQHEKSAP